MTPSRRQFMSGASAAVAAPFLPPVPSLLATTPVEDLPVIEGGCPCIAIAVALAGIVVTEMREAAGEEGGGPVFAALMYQPS